MVNYGIMRRDVLYFGRCLSTCPVTFWLYFQGRKFEYRYRINSKLLCLCQKVPVVTFKENVILVFHKIFYFCVEINTPIQGVLKVIVL